MHRVMISFPDGRSEDAYFARIPVAGDEIQLGLETVTQVVNVRLIGRSPEELGRYEDPRGLLMAVVQVEAP